MKILNDFFASAYIAQSLIRYIIYIKNVEQAYRSGPVFFFFDNPHPPAIVPGFSHVPYLICYNGFIHNS